MHFVYKLVPPRPTFAFDMDETEAELMGKHAAYWRDQLDQGKVVVFGPVMDPAGMWGLGVLDTEDDAEAHGLVLADPVIAAGCAPSSCTPSTQSCALRDDPTMGPALANLAVSDGRRQRSLRRPGVPAGAARGWSAVDRLVASGSA